YCGEYTDEETGFIYLRNRYYDPSIGRFISEDPANSGSNWYVYCENNPVKFVDPWGLDAIIITAEDAAMSQGHTSVLIQDTNDGNWYYFYWGDKAAYYIAVPWQDGAMSSLDAFNSWLSGLNLPYNTTGYTSATFVEGYFNASSNYFKNLIANTTIESGYRYEASTYEKPTYNYYVENTSYKLFGKNCLQMSMEGFYKGTLKDGTNVGTFMSGQLGKTWLADTRPNSAEPVFNQLFFNRRFTRTEAKNDVAWEARYGSPPERYKSKGRHYARTLGVI
ncbi:RHS repeat-associated core domain-containing protein, partial [Congzhengia sp.]|uniref:RHS repeat-associated core domain-containing protein n=1 Tax=Congzhengia sp. TaxID=2944168 RepID=UPI0030770D3B